MKTINHLVYFLNTLQKELNFVDSEDFNQKIKNNFNFRVKVQKLVYISKFFGWEHNYNYKLYERGPYSSTLANEYYDNNLFNYPAAKIENFNQTSFLKLIHRKNNIFLEAISTILFLKMKIRNFH